MSSEFESVYHGPEGIIAWRRGTGDNVELTYILARQPNNGCGKRLFREMLLRLKGNPPYNGLGTIYGFTRLNNDAAIKFYESCGFVLTPVSGVYADSQAVVFSQNYETLCGRNL